MTTIYYDLIPGIKQKPDLPLWQAALNNKWSAATRCSGPAWKKWTCRSWTIITIVDKPKSDVLSPRLAQSLIQKSQSQGPWTFGLPLKSYTGHHHPTAPPHNFERVWVGAFVSDTSHECQEGVPSNSQWTVRWRALGCPLCSRRTLSKKLFHKSKE